MNIQTCKDMLLNYYDNLKFEESTSEGKIRLIAKGVKFKAFDDDTRIEFTFNENGAASVTFVLDQLKPSGGNYDLINDFNDNIGFLKAYISERNGKYFFALEHYVYEVVTEKNAVETLVAMVKMLTSDNTLKYLLPITKHTK